MHVTSDVLGCVTSEYVLKTDKTHSHVPGQLLTLARPNEVPHIAFATLVQYVGNELKSHHGMEVSKAHIATAIKHFYEKNFVDQFRPVAGTQGKKLGISNALKGVVWANKESKTTAPPVIHFWMNAGRERCEIDHLKYLECFPEVEDDTE